MNVKSTLKILRPSRTENVFLQDGVPQNFYIATVMAFLGRNSPRKRTGLPGGAA